MQYKFFSVPAINSELSGQEEEFNSFLRSHRIINVQRELINNGANSFWSCCVEFIENNSTSFTKGAIKEKVDYRSLLSEEEFIKFKLLRECRKQIAEEEAIPPFAIFLDEHLAGMVKLPQIDLISLRKINGVGEKKVEKYGSRFLELWKEKSDEANRKSISQNS